jgi:hypothetical protein
MRVSTWALRVGLSLLAMGGATTAVFAQPPDDSLKEQFGAAGKQFGESLGSYIGHKMALQFEIRRLTESVQRCGSCQDRPELERQLAKARGTEQMINETEGALLQSMGLKYDNFSAFVSALVADFTSDRLTDSEQFALDVNTANSFRYPLARWCKIFEPGSIPWDCAERWMKKWASEMRVPFSKDFPYELQRQDRLTRIACAKSLQELRPSASPGEDELLQCQAPLFEFVRLKNQMDAYCIQQGAKLELSNRVVAHYSRCDQLIKQRKQ